MDKKEIIEFLNKEETYNIVEKQIIKSSLLELSRDYTYEQYPLSQGYIAGGSIANTIYNILYKKNTEPVINDIDFFIFKKTEDIDWGSTSVVGDERFINNDNLNLNSDGYGNVWFGPNGENMRMVSSVRNLNWNTILICVGTNSDEINQQDYYKGLLDNFDLNCCCAGLDTINKKIIYNNKFIEFLVNDKIEVVSLLTPLNTAIRLINKTKALKTNCDLKSEIELLKHGFLEDTMPRHKTIGKIWYDKYRKNKRFVNKHFIVKKVDRDRIPFIDGIFVFHGRKYGS